MMKIHNRKFYLIFQELKVLTEERMEARIAIKESGENASSPKPTFQSMGPPVLKLDWEKLRLFSYR